MKENRSDTRLGHELDITDCTLINAWRNGLIELLILRRHQAGRVFISSSNIVILFATYYGVCKIVFS